MVFFPSYDYLATVLKVWSSSSGILNSLSRLKPIFHEPQSTGSTNGSANANTNTDSLLSQYSASVDAGKGGLLLSVMGGKLSEGINFSDALGRGVIVVGLPFPNTRNAIWQAKLQHVEKKAYELADPSRSEEERRACGKAASRAFYENTCMRTVNQCIGRAIRHKGDYAAILMIDRRYQSERIQGKLPGWIRGSLLKGHQGDLHGQLQHFFQSKP